MRSVDFSPHTHVRGQRSAQREPRCGATGLLFRSAGNAAAGRMRGVHTQIIPGHENPTSAKLNYFEQNVAAAQKESVRMGGLVPGSRTRGPTIGLPKLAAWVHPLIRDVAEHDAALVIGRIAPSSRPGVEPAAGGRYPRK